MRLIFLTVTALFLAVTPSAARTVEFLQASITPANVSWLAGIACRNFDHIVHLDVAVNWPDNSLEVERSGLRRLVFWDSKDEYLFPKGSFFLLHGSYIINGYFIARSGGIHQGVTSNAFERVNNAQLKLTPGHSENRIQSAACHE